MQNRLESCHRRFCCNRVVTSRSSRRCYGALLMPPHPLFIGWRRPYPLCLGSSGPSYASPLRYETNWRGENLTGAISWHLCHHQHKGIFHVVVATYYLTSSMCVRFFGRALHQLGLYKREPKIHPYSSFSAGCLLMLTGRGQVKTV